MKTDALPNIWSDRATFDELLRRSDVVSIHVRLIDATRGMDIAITTTARTNEEAKALLEELAA